MSSRTPRPRTPRIWTLRELVLDLESRLQVVVAPTEVVLPHDEWMPLVKAAEAELERPPDVMFGLKEALCRTMGIAENSSDTEMFLAVKNLAHPPPPEEEVEPAGAPADRLPPRGGKRSYSPEEAAEQLLAGQRDRADKQRSDQERKAQLRKKAKGPKKKAPVKIIPGVTPFIKPFRIRVGGKLLPEKYANRQGAVADAEFLGHSKFEVEDGRGRVCDFVDVPPKAKRSKRVMKKAVKPGAAVAFMREFSPSPELAEVVGAKPLPRTMVIKKLWEYFKKHKLNTGHLITLDDKLKAVFGNKKTIKIIEVSKAFLHLEETRRAKPAKPAAPKKVNMDERVKAELERGLILDAGRRLNGAGWKRSAKKARDENSTTECHHCGAGPDDDAGEIYSGGLGFEQLLPLGALCGGCRLRLRENPREFDRHSVESGSRKAKKPAEEPVQPVVQVTLEEAIKRTATTAEPRAPAPPSRPTKKFPLQSGPTEKCTQCGAEQGDHSGTRCPFPSTAPQEIPAAAPPQAELSQ